MGLTPRTVEQAESSIQLGKRTKHRSVDANRLCRSARPRENRRHISYGVFEKGFSRMTKTLTIDYTSFPRLAARSRMPYLLSAVRSLPIPPRGDRYNVNTQSDASSRQP
jgi:hypothetical protein